MQRLREDNDDLRERLACAHREIEQLGARPIVLIHPAHVAAPRLRVSFRHYPDRRGYWITSSARSRMDYWIVSPSVFADFIS